MASASDNVVLETIGLEKRFGGLVATSDFNFKLEAGAGRYTGGC